ncbi:hypothetical protein ANN_06512 [Periplaneta americana]|uniref:THAP-type domain-containing protein n=1 Tax=Periplaneta americana TaxID=6978 RepID=A0ABQ8TDW7_PERAM|nr:hypothetical protein ANN_06512 [Periplaneta americana]
MSPGSSTESYPAFAHIGLRENPAKNLNQVTCPDRESNPGHLVSQPDALTVTPQQPSKYRETGRVGIVTRQTDRRNAAADDGTATTISTMIVTGRRRLLGRLRRDEVALHHLSAKDDSVCKQWIHACRRKDKINIKYATVCSVHFLPEDYERDLKAELLNIKPKKMLKISAVPSLHLDIDSRPNKMNIEASSSHQPESPQITVSDRQTRQINRHSRKRGLERLKTLSPKKKKFDVGTITDSTSDSERHLKARLDKLEKDNKQMQTEMNKLKLKNKSLTLALSRKSKHIQQLENRINAKVKERVSIVLRKIFTENQIKNLLVTKRSQNGQEKI